MARFRPSFAAAITALAAGSLLAGLASSQGSSVASSAGGLTFAAPDPARVASLLPRCQGCHGSDWQGGRGPQLRGKSAETIRSALAAYRAGTRSHPGMQGVARPLTDQQIADLAAAISGDRTAPAPTAPVAPASTAPASSATTPAAPAPDGKKLYTSGDSKRDILACAVCHGETGQGEGDRLGLPDLRGRSASSVAEALWMYRALKPEDSIYPDAMRIAVKNLTDAEIQALAAYVATLK